MNVQIDGTTIVGEVEIEEPPEAVFEAFTDPEQLASWWGSADTYRTFNWKVDLRPGGSYSCNAKNANGQGGDATVHGKYLEVDPPRLLVYTWNPSWDPGPETEVRLVFEKTSRGTTVKLSHSGFAGREQSQQGHTQGWLRVITWLRDFSQNKEKSK